MPAAELEARSENMAHLAPSFEICTATLQDGEIRCQLERGHDGKHHTRQGGHDAYWLTTVQAVSVAPDGQQIPMGPPQEYHEEPV